MTHRRRRACGRSRTSCATPRTSLSAPASARGHVWGAGARGCGAADERAPVSRAGTSSRVPCGWRCPASQRRPASSRRSSAPRSCCRRACRPGGLSRLVLPRAAPRQLGNSSRVPPAGSPAGRRAARREHGADQPGGDRPVCGALCRGPARCQRTRGAAHAGRAALSDGLYIRDALWVPRFCGSGARRRKQPCLRQGRQLAVGVQACPARQAAPFQRCSSKRV